MGQAQINVRTRACSRTSIARTRQAALTHNVRGKELINSNFKQTRYVPLHECLEEFCHSIAIGTSYQPLQ